MQATRYSSHGLFGVTQNVMEYVRPRLNVLGLAEVYRHSCETASAVLFEQEALVGRSAWVLMTFHPIAIEIVLPK